MELIDHAVAMFGERLAPDGSLVAENFARWFGDSQVVGATGAPQTLFHGASVWERPDRQLGNIDVFNRRASVEIVRRPEGLDAIGSWFTNNPARAVDYCGMSGAIYPVFLKMENPWVIDTYDTLVEAWVDDQDRSATSAEARARFKRNRLWGDADQFVRGLRMDGVDGIIIKRCIGANGSTEFADQDAYIVWEPSQIKSATGNSGLFDPHSPGIADAHAWDVPVLRERMRA